MKEPKTSIKDLWRRERKDGESLRAFARRIKEHPVAAAWLSRKGAKR